MNKRREQNNISDPGTFDKLSDSALNALKWNYAGTTVRALSQLTINIILARMLGPKPFGIVAVTWLVIGLGTLLADFGFASALIQRKRISDHDIRCSFTLQVILGLALTVLGVASADGVARIFSQPEVAPVLRILSLTFLIQSFGLTASGLMRRRLDFKGLQYAHFFSYIPAYFILGIPLAARGFGVWSLVIAQLCQVFLKTVIVYLRSGHSMVPCFSSGGRGLLDFGSKFMATNVINWIILNLDNLFVGRCLGTLPLGLYNRSYYLMATPTNSALSILQGVLFPVYAKAQDSRDILVKCYLASLSLVALIILPVFGSIAIVPGTIIDAIYGAQWHAASPLLIPLALAMPFHALMTLGSPVLSGIGKVDRELRVQSIVAILFLILLVIVSRSSIIAVAWIVFMVYAVRFLLLTDTVLKTLDLAWGEIFYAVRGPLALWAGVSLAIMITRTVLTLFEMSSLACLVVFALTGLATFLSLCRLSKGLVVTPDIAWLFDRFSGKLPRFIYYLIPSRPQC